MSTEAGKLDASSYAWNVMRSSPGLYFLASAFAVKESFDQYEALSLGNRGAYLLPSDLLRFPAWSSLTVLP